MFKIIDNKKVDITNDEYRMYEVLCSNHSPHGKDIFKNLFEVDDDGVIVCLIPPTKSFSLDAVLFLQNLMIHQHLRRIYKEHEQAMGEVRELIAEVKKNEF
jgi:hypothetical protein